jgi:phage N-6-adenine-methyltransferase
MKAIRNASRQDWATPLWFVADTEQRLGIRYDLDVCASAANTKCDHYFTEVDNGLTKPWTGTIWCNPPYNDIRAWVRKAIEECKRGYCPLITLLIPARTEALYTQELAQCGHATIEFVYPRLNFELSGVRTTGVAMGSMLVHLNPAYRKLAVYWTPLRTR